MNDIEILLPAYICQYFEFRLNVVNPVPLTTTVGDGRNLTYFC